MSSPPPPSSSDIINIATIIHLQIFLQHQHFRRHQSHQNPHHCHHHHRNHLKLNSKLLSQKHHWGSTCAWGHRSIIWCQPYHGGGAVTQSPDILETKFSSACHCSGYWCKIRLELNQSRQSNLYVRAQFINIKGLVWERIVLNLTAGRSTWHLPLFTDTNMNVCTLRPVRHITERSEVAFLELCENKVIIKKPKYGMLNADAHVHSAI